MPEINQPSYVKMVSDTPLPRIALCRQVFPAKEINDPAKAIADTLSQAACSQKLKPGMSIAITAGSRGIASYPELLRAIVSEVRARGAIPFAVPAMGSHGGATAEGQVALLAKLGITEEVIGCPIRSSMDTVEVGRLEGGQPVVIDRIAHEADGIILFNRIKAHTGFRAPNESGLVKMLAIGLGKQSGAEICHSRGNDKLPVFIDAMARIKLEQCDVLFGIGTVENAYDRLSEVVILDNKGLVEAEQPHLRHAMENMPRLPLGPMDAPTASGNLDVLLVDQIGKEFSGAGMDPNITHRFAYPNMPAHLTITRLVALELSSHSNGNGLGVSRADVVTQRLEDAFDREAVYANALTATSLQQAKMPMVMPCDRCALQAALKTCGVDDPRQAQLLRVPNTLHLGYFYASEAMLPAVRDRPNTEVLSAPEEMLFQAGRLVNPWPGPH